MNFRNSKGLFVDLYIFKHKQIIHELILNSNYENTNFLYIIVVIEH